MSSAVPGTSEHQTGLAMDITSQSAKFQLETIYLYGFIIATILTVIYIFFGDIFESIFSVGGGSVSVVTLL
ncbi:D-alanyl-D-alanine carboxypeptidase family protein, partial [Bacillus cereus]